jgi:hypothetical protein
MKFILMTLLICLLMSTTSPAVQAQSCKDAIIASTPDGNFTIHNDGKVLHNTTGLIWMRCSLGQKWDGKLCSGMAGSFTWQGALEAAKKTTFAGHADWRLPNKNELESIVEERCSSPSINSSVFPGTPSAYFWSSSPYAGLAHGAWSVDFGFGSVNASVKSGNIHVRLVRGGQ